MSIDANLRAQVQAFSAKQGVDAPFAEATRQEGLLNGQKVQTADTSSAVANAAEEVSFAASEKVEKTLSERKAGSKESLRASATELAAKYVNMMAEPQAGRKLSEFLDALKNMGNAATEADIRQLLGEHFQDSSDQFAALSFAEESLAKEGGSDATLAKIKSLKEQLLKEAGPAIRSGLNIASDVLAAAKQGLETAGGLRDLYRFAILGGQNAAAIYLSIMSRYGPKQFAQSLDFLLRAAGSDLEGRVMGSSLEAPQLKNAMDDIYHVQALGNMHRSFSDLLDGLRRLFPS